MNQIDIASIIRRRIPHAARFIPRAAIDALRRLLHESDINTFLGECRDAQPQQIFTRWMQRLDVGCRIEGLERLPTDGRYIVAANHPFGGLDGVAACMVLGERFGGVRAIVNDMLMNIEQLRSVWVPVNKYGAQSQQYTSIVHDALASDYPVLTFPAGLCSRRTERGTEDLTWHPSFIRMARRYDRTIVPLYIEGALSERFYRVARWRKRLGIRFNIEMLLLPDEMYRQRGSRIVMHIGCPVAWDDLKTLPSAAAQSVEIRRRVYALSPNTTVL